MSAQSLRVEGQNPQHKTSQGMEPGRRIAYLGDPSSTRARIECCTVITCPGKCACASKGKK